MADLRGPDGVRGVDLERPDGSKVKLNADKSGRIEVNDKKAIEKLRSEGFTSAGLTIGGFASPGYSCVNESCSFNGVFPKYTCSRCGTENDQRS